MITFAITSVINLFFVLTVKIPVGTVTNILTQCEMLCLYCMLGTPGCKQKTGLSQTIFYNFYLLLTLLFL